MWRRGVPPRRRPTASAPGSDFHRLNVHACMDRFLPLLRCEPGDLGVRLEAIAVCPMTRKRGGIAGGQPMNGIRLHPRSGGAVPNMRDAMTRSLRAGGLSVLLCSGALAAAQDQAPALHCACTGTGSCADAACARTSGAGTATVDDAGTAPFPGSVPGRREQHSREGRVRESGPGPVSTVAGDSRCHGAGSCAADARARPAACSGRRDFRRCGRSLRVAGRDASRRPGSRRSPEGGRVRGNGPAVDSAHARVHPRGLWR